jgi:hypothetical protein
VTDALWSFLLILLVICFAFCWMYAVALLRCVAGGGLCYRLSSLDFSGLFSIG